MAAILTCVQEMGTEYGSASPSSVQVSGNSFLPLASLQIPS